MPCVVSPRQFKEVLLGERSLMRIVDWSRVMKWQLAIPDDSHEGNSAFFNAKYAESSVR